MLYVDGIYALLKSVEYICWLEIYLQTPCIVLVKDIPKEKSIKNDYFTTLLNLSKPHKNNNYV